MKFPSPLLSGILIRRYRRSLADVELENGDIVTAHVFSLGSMKGCCEPGRPVLLSDSGDLSRRHPLTWELINMNNIWVGVNPTISRKVVQESLQNGAIKGLRRFHIVAEAKLGKPRRVDFVLQSMEKNCYINVHSVTWAEKGRARFPDAASETHRRAIRELSVAARQGHRAIALFHVLRRDCKSFQPARDVDGYFFRALTDAQRAGVQILAFRAEVSPSGISLGKPIPVLME
jgi:sugar fermentation stimulation protein A